jgi:Protein of unknown function (DUF2971)
MLSERKLTLVRPRLWNDPFENFILQSVFRLPHGEVVTLPASKRLYGQCWSHTKESDAMWRMYAPLGDGVKLRADPKSLGALLRNINRSHPKIQGFVGKVRYIARLNLPDNLAAHFSIGDALLDVTGRQHARSLLFKRTTFSHENEVRLICVRQDDGDDQDVISFPIDPLAIFDLIVFDPRMTTEDYEQKRAAVIALGFPPERIQKSRLYGKQGVIVDIARGTPLPDR